MLHAGLLKRNLSSFTHKSRDKLLTKRQVVYDTVRYTIRFHSDDLLNLMSNQSVCDLNK